MKDTGSHKMTNKINATARGSNAERSTGQRVSQSHQTDYRRSTCRIVIARHSRVSAQSVNTPFESKGNMEQNFRRRAPAIGVDASCNIAAFPRRIGFSLLFRSRMSLSP